MTENDTGRTANGSRASATATPILLGPEIVDWLIAAARLPARSLHIALALVFANEGRSLTTIVLPNLPLLEMKLDRCAKYRGLAHLERAGLVRVDRRPGRSPTVTICQRERR